MNINPIFRQTLPQPSPAKVVKQSQTPAKKRVTRSDKCRDIKFPVTDQVRAVLLRAADSEKKKETAYCTGLLSKALSLPYPITAIPEYAYQDTRQYIHVKPTALPYEKILEMKIHFKISRREAVYRLIRFIMEREGMWPHEKIQ